MIDGAQPSVRSDLYAAGVLLFFLVSGQFPVSGASLDEIRAAHAKSQRNRLRDLRPEIPAGFVRAIECATALDPGDRPDSAGALEAMLDDGRVLREQEEGVSVSKRSRARPAFYAGLAAAVVAVAAILWLALQSLRPAPSNAVAVLPFVNVSNDDETASFSAGIADKVAARLTGSGRLHVIAGAPVAAYARGDRTRGEIGVALGAASALSGSVIRSDREFHVDVQLVDAQTGEVLWTDTFERAAGNAGAQLDISRDVSAAVTSVLSLAESESLGRTRPRDRRRSPCIVRPATTRASGARPRCGRASSTTRRSSTGSRTMRRRTQAWRTPMR